VLETLHSRKWNGILENTKNGVQILSQDINVWLRKRAFLRVLRLVKVLQTFCQHTQKLQINLHGIMAFCYKVPPS